MKFALEVGLSFSLGDIIYPARKANKMIDDAIRKLKELWTNYNMGPYYQQRALQSGNWMFGLQQTHKFWQNWQWSV